MSRFSWFFFNASGEGLGEREGGASNLITWILLARLHILLRLHAGLRENADDLPSALGSVRVGACGIVA